MSREGVEEGAMMGRRFFLAAALASLLASVGCLRNMCERNGYYPVAGAAPACCVPCCNPCAPAAAGYVGPTPASTWNAPAAVPAAVPAPSGACVCPPQHQ
jgi:hypothetical protein